MPEITNMLINTRSVCVNRNAFITASAGRHQYYWLGRPSDYIMKGTRATNRKREALGQDHIFMKGQSMTEESLPLLGNVSQWKKKICSHWWKFVNIVGMVLWHCDAKEKKCPEGFYQLHIPHNTVACISIMSPYHCAFFHFIFSPVLSPSLLDGVSCSFILIFSCQPRSSL